MTFDAPGSPEKILEIDFNPFCLIEYIHRNRLVVGPALLLDYYRKKKGLPYIFGSIRLKRGPWNHRDPFNREKTLKF